MMWLGSLAAGQGVTDATGHQLSYAARLLGLGLFGLLIGLPIGVTFGVLTSVVAGR